MSLKLAIIKANKGDKKQIKAFYKKERYSASFIGHDDVYFIKGDDDKIVACVMYSLGKDNRTQRLLHALVVSKNLRKQGIASFFLKHTLNNYSQVIAFISPELLPFYSPLKFIQLTPERLTPSLNIRFLTYQRQQNNLLCLSFKPVLDK